MVGTSRRIGRLLHTRSAPRRRARNPIEVRPGLLLALLGAVALYLWSRTESGASMVGKVVSAAGDATAVVRDAFMPRGIRNNNPGNIDRTRDQWRGMSADQSTDSRFVVFDAPVWGLRAMARILRKDMAEGDTLRKIINEWAPPNENATGAYVNAVAAAAGVHPDAQVGAAHLPAIMAAIVQHENGQQPYPIELFAQAIELEQSA